MERPELKLVTAEPVPSRTPAAAALGAAVLGAAALATVFGADAARRPFDPGPVAESALARSLAAGDPAPTREAEDVFRARLRRTPLDAASRTIAASLLAETAATDAQRLAAVDQTLAATRLIASDEWISRAAARVLTRCGRTDLALHEISRMFAYAPREAAATLADIEPFVAFDRVEDGLPATPGAWLAWSVKLREDGREGEADARLATVLSRWPADLTALGVAANVAAGRDRIDELQRLVPPSLALPSTPETAPLYLLRARSKAAAGDVAGSHADALRAIALSHGNPWILAGAGDVFAASEPALARDYWTRALYRLLALPATRGEAIWLRYRLARLDDREGQAGNALRAWRSILAERPDDGEAKRRVAELTGEVPR